MNYSNTRALVLAFLAINAVDLITSAWTTSAEAQIVVATNGNDENLGTEEKPVATLERARDLARRMRTQPAKPLSIMLRTGVFYLPETLILSQEDSGTQNAKLTIAASPGHTPVISGGQKLELAWQSSADGVMQAVTPAGLKIDQMWVNGERKIMARFPNRIEGKNLFDRWDLNHAGRSEDSEDAIAISRIAGWKDPAGGYLHAMHPGLWGDMHWRISGKNPNGKLDWEGGWQNNRPGPMHGKYRFIENVREELDAVGEWFHDAKANTLYYIPESDTDMRSAMIEVVRLAHLIEFRGSKEKPVEFVTLRGLTFRHTARTFMENSEPLLRSDWTVYRGGAVVYNGATDCTVTDCTFDQVGGNTIFVNNWNRRIAVQGCLIQNSGANGVAFVGDPKAVRSPIFRYGPQDYSKLDRTPGPLTDNFPADCVVEDCLIARTGRDEKQTAPIQISMSQDITIRHCSIYDVPRAGINISEGTWGGHLIEHCDIFNTVLETGDHGSFNSWGRDRFWDPSIEVGNKQVAADPNLPLLDMVKPNVLRNNRWRCDHGWDIDLDDGSSNYQVYNNLLLNGGLKLREGFYRKVYNNITVNNSLHPHCWYDHCADAVTRNIFMGSYQPAGGMPAGKWGSTVDRNLFTTSDIDRTRFAGNQCDAHSLVGDAQFIDPANGDYRVKESSPAMMLGFENFPMDQFGVQKPELKGIAKTPELPKLRTKIAETQPQALRSTMFWLQATVKALAGEEYSAFGVSREAGGLQLTTVPTGSPAAKSGFQKGDLLMKLNGQPLVQLSDLVTAIHAARGKSLVVDIVRQQKTHRLEVVAYTFYASTGFADRTQGLPLTDKPATVPFVKIESNPQTNNEPLTILEDGKLATNYGPVFANTVAAGFYKVDLGQTLSLYEFNAWSYSEGARGSQHFVLYGSSLDVDPGWTVDEAESFTPIAEVNTLSLPVAKFNVTSVRHSRGESLGKFRWLVLKTYPLNTIGEHTAFQEFQVSDVQGGTVLRGE